MKRGRYKVVLNDADHRVLVADLRHPEMDGAKVMGWWFQQLETEVFVPLHSVFMMEAV